MSINHICLCLECNLFLFIVPHCDFYLCRGYTNKVYIHITTRPETNHTKKISLRISNLLHVAWKPVAQPSQLLVQCWKLKLTSISKYLQSSWFYSTNFLNAQLRQINTRLYSQCIKWTQGHNPFLGKTPSSIAFYLILQIEWSGEIPLYFCI